MEKNKKEKIRDHLKYFQVELNLPKFKLKAIKYDKVEGYLLVNKFYKQTSPIFPRKLL